MTMEIRDVAGLEPFPGLFLIDSHCLSLHVTWHPSDYQVKSCLECTDP